MNISKEDLNLIRQWFNSVQDVIPTYLEPDDYRLAHKVYLALDMKVPNSVIKELSPIYYKDHLKGIEEKCIGIGWPELKAEGESWRNQIGNDKLCDAIDKLGKESES